MSKRENPVDPVLDRMVEAVLGENAHFKSHADALGIPANTIKTWRRRGEVPAGYLAQFARDWKTSVDWLLYGMEGKLILGDDPTHRPPMERKSSTQRALADDERKLLENYRNSSPEVKEALQLVASMASRPQGLAPVAKPSRVKVRSSELAARKFEPSRLKVMGDEVPEKTPARSGKKRNKGDSTA